MGLPCKLTLEEQALLNKFALFKKKKKAENSSRRFVSTDNHASLNIVKRELTEEVGVAANKDAKEIAKKLIASGKLKINKSSENRSFKRVKVSEKKSRPTLKEAELSGKLQSSKKIEAVRNAQYSNFRSAGTGDKGSDNGAGSYCNDRASNLSSNNLHVSGYGLTKNILDIAFSPFGPIKSMFLEKDKGYGYVTFNSHEAAEKAVSELHGSMVQNVTLRVSYARKRSATNRDDNRYTWRPKVSNNLDEPLPDKRSPPHAVKSKNHNGARLPRLFDNSLAKPNNNTRVMKKQELVTYDEDSFDF